MPTIRMRIITKIIRIKAGQRMLLRIIMINMVWQPKSVMSDHEATMVALWEIMPATAETIRLTGLITVPIQTVR